MNEAALKCLKERRSIRAYKSEQIKEAELQAVLEAGLYTPTGMGKQSPKMVVVQDPELVKQLSQMNAAVMNSTNDPFYGAPTVIIVFADSTIHTYLYDGSLVMGNLMNAAHAVGLGSCWIHRAKETFKTPEGKALMAQWGVPEHFEGIGNCILGYADEQPQPKARKQDYIVRT